MSHLSVRRLRLGIVGTTLALVAAGLAAPTATADGCDSQVNNTYKKLLGCVSLDGARAHQAALQEIADAHGGIRTSGTAGYNASAAYAADVFRNAGYDVTVQEFVFNTFIVLTPTVLEVVSPASSAGPVANSILSYSGSGDVTAPVSSPVALGCNVADFAGFPAGNIALIPRGTCTFAVKAGNAFNAGAAGVVIANNTGGTINGTLGAGFTLDIPVTSVTQADGAALAALIPTGLTMHLRASTLRGPATTSNVIAQSRTGNPDNVVMLGAHLDSVNAGPGLQDNGSGSAAILEVAEAMAKVSPTNQVRFALWGAEESGLVGSTRYVASLSAEERAKIALYLNFDMIGSPNHVFFVYDGDDSDAVGSGPGPAGSAQIEALFHHFYAQTGESSKGTDFSGRSDYKAFIDNGIPAGGLFTGAEGVKTAAEAAIWGGTAGQAYDPCYHQACDTFANINLHALEVNVDAVAYAALTYANSTETVNGVVGTMVPGAPSAGSGNPNAAGFPGNADHELHEHQPDAR